MGGVNRPTSANRVPIERSKPSLMVLANIPSPMAVALCPAAMSDVPTNATAEASSAAALERLARVFGQKAAAQILFKEANKAILVKRDHKGLGKPR